jgi:GNAT superfamily N-acetyltransferase
VLGDPEIVEFREELAPAFERLNREWLEAFSLLEEGDLPYLADPRGNIVERGGVVLFAVDHGEVLGTVASIPLTGEVFELAKLAVAPPARGRGIGRALVAAAIEWATSAGAVRLVLSSNSRLEAALRLYESFGFRRTSRTCGVAYVSADVFLELELPPTGTARAESRAR